MGADTVEVITRLVGLSAEEVERLGADGVVGVEASGSSGGQEPVVTGSRPHGVDGEA